MKRLTILVTTTSLIKMGLAVLEWRPLILKVLIVRNQAMHGMQWEWIKLVENFCCAVHTAAAVPAPHQRVGWEIQKIQEEIQKLGRNWDFLSRSTVGSLPQTRARSGKFPTKFHHSYSRPASQVRGGKPNKWMSSVVNTTPSATTNMFISIRWKYRPWYFRMFWVAAPTLAILWLTKYYMSNR